jgi:hypothetical protein
MVKALLTPAWYRPQVGKWTRYVIRPWYAGWAFTVNRPLCRTTPVLTPRHWLAPYNRCSVTLQLDGAPATEPFTGTTVPTAALGDFERPVRSRGHVERPGPHAVLQGAGGPLQVGRHDALERPGPTRALEDDEQREAFVAPTSGAVSSAAITRLIRMPGSLAPVRSQVTWPITARSGQGDRPVQAAEGHCSPGGHTQTVSRTVMVRTLDR